MKLKEYDIELYCGIDQYIITNLGMRKFKYGKTNIVKKKQYIKRKNKL